MVELEDWGLGNGRDDDHGWDLWWLKLSNYTLVLGRNERYELDLERCRTSAEMLDWIAQLAHKSWATPAILSGAVHALDDVLEPQRNLCGFGVSKRLSRSTVRKLVDAFGSEHSELLERNPGDIVS